MRKDSELFLKMVLKYRKEIEEDSFELNISYFDNIPNITTSIKDILNDLISNNCLTSLSKEISLEGNIFINLTLDGITYFDEKGLKENISQYVFNVSGGQVNIADNNGLINTVVNNNVDFEVYNKEIKLDDLLIDFCSEDCFIYSTNVPENSLVINDIDTIDNELYLKAKFNIVPQNDYSDKFTGYCIKDIPRDWRGLIENGYFLNINYKVDNNINMWVEIKTPHVELYKRKFLLNEESRIFIDLGKYMKDKGRWINISELCLVFRPCYEKTMNSNIQITNIGFVK